MAEAKNAARRAEPRHRHVAPDQTYAPPSLVVLERPSRIEVIRARAKVVLMGSVLFVLLAGAVFARAEMASMQNALQRLQGSVETTSSQNASLSDSLAKLSSAKRIVSYAESKLGMVPSQSSKVVTGSNVGAAVTPASVPPAPGTAPYPPGSQVAPTTTTTSPPATTTTTVTTVPSSPGAGTSG